MAKRTAVAAAAILLLGMIPLVASSAAGAGQTAKVVTIKGHDSFRANAYLLNTYHFEPGLIKAKQGQQVVFHNETTDAHTMTLVVTADVPTTIPAVFKCKLCNAVNRIYQFGHGQPAGVQIDNGVLNDDHDADADTPDPLAPGPFHALIEDFDTPAHSNPNGAPPTIGDSTLLGPVGSPAPTSRTIVVTAAPGAVLHYICTIHPWMQATILVTK